MLRIFALFLFTYSLYMRDCFDFYHVGLFYVFMCACDVTSHGASDRDYRSSLK